VKIEKFKSGSINRVEVYNADRSVVITVGDIEFNLKEVDDRLEIQKHDGRITILPNVSNEIIIY
jgi:virulence-associated protein VagC